MMNWTKLLRHPEAIDSLYEKPPSLQGFALSEITWQREDDACVLRGTLAQFADFPRSQWEDDANRVGIRMRLEGVDDFEMDGWSFENLVDLQIDQTDGGAQLIVTADGDDVSFRVRCSGLHVSDVFAYHAVRPETSN